MTESGFEPTSWACASALLGAFVGPIELTPNPQEQPSPKEVQAKGIKAPWSGSWLMDLPGTILPHQKICFVVCERDCCHVVGIQRKYGGQSKK